MSHRNAAFISLGRARIGAGRCFVIAEAGVNHNGRLDLARRLVAAAAAAGADAVKFQAFVPELLVSASARRAPYQRRAGRGSQLDMLRALALAPAQFAVLAADARRRGLVFLVTPFDESSLESVVRIGVRAIKLGSGEVTNTPLLRRAAATGLPLLLSTGMSTFDEIDRAVADCRRAQCRAIALFHCVSVYPAPAAALNLRAIPAMRDRYRVPVGFSDHSLGERASIAAVALGAAAIEKHLTLDTRLRGPDHKASLDPPAFARFVAAIRETEAALGDGIKRCTPEERANVRFVRRSLAARVPIGRGAKIHEADLIAIRPAAGIPPTDLNRVVGRRAARPIAAGQPLTWAALAAGSR